MIRTLLPVLLFLLAPSVFGQVGENAMVVCGKKVKYRQLKVAGRADFQYLVYDNIASEDNRSIAIHMFKREFSDENLMNLFTRLSRKYPAPHYLLMYLETNSKLIPEPGKCPRDAISGEPDTDTAEDYPRAFYYRVEGKEFFRIYSERYAPAKEVIIKDSKK
ncbi:MAG TPA: hypothetical protein VF599_25095 [Pyrinomonadaceae bacterium]|jgi:hypothetical protein